MRRHPPESLKDKRTTVRKRGRSCGIIPAPACLGGVSAPAHEHLNHLGVVMVEEEGSVSLSVSEESSLKPVDLRRRCKFNKFIS